MRRVHDQLEERRVMRLLDGAAADVPELSRTEIAVLLTDARGRPRQTRRFAVAAHRARLLVPAAAAAVLAAVTLVGGGIPGQAPRNERSPSATGGVVEFPAASALELLLDRNRAGAT